MKSLHLFTIVLLATLLTGANDAFAQADLTAPTGTITYCTSHATYPGTLAFDNGGNGGSSRWLADMSSSPNSWVQYQFPSPTCVASYKVFGFDSSNNGLSRDPKNWNFEGSNDGTSWVLLDAQTNQTGWTSLQTRSFLFNNDNSYTHYRFTITANNGASDYTGLLELEFYANPNAPDVPGVTATSATPTLSTRAILGATLIMGGTSDLTFHWGTTSGVWTGSQTFQNIAVGAFSAEVSGFDLFRTYYWTVSAENAHGSAWAPITNSFISVIGADFTRPDDTITGCSSLAGYPPSNAFDNGGRVDTSRWLPYATNFPNAWLQCQILDGPYQIQAYRITGLSSANFATRNPQVWTLSGSTDGTTWDLIDTQTGQTGWTEGQERTFAVSAENSYDYYRLNIVTNNGATDYSGVLELELFGIPDFTAPPQLVSGGVEQTAAGSAVIKGILTAGGSAGVFVAWGTDPDNLVNTNSIGNIYCEPFGIPVSGLTPFQTYYYTLIATNVEGIASIDGAPLSFVAQGERFTWTGVSGNWEDVTKWSPSTRAPNALGDLVVINSVRTIALNASATLGGLTLSGPYAQGTVVITNANPSSQLVFDNPAGEAFINADVGGAAPYQIYPDLVLNEDVNVNSTETYPVQLRGAVSGPGKLIQQTGARIHLAPVKDVIFDNLFRALSATSYLSIGGSENTVTLRGVNTLAFYGNWNASSTLSSGAKLMLDGGLTTNLNASTRASFTYSNTVDASLTLTNGAQLVNASSSGAPLFSGSGNRVTLSGSGSLWNLNGGELQLNGTSNQFVLAQGGLMDKAPFSARGSSAILLVSGSETLWNANGRFCFGKSGNLNQATINDGAVVSNCTLFVAGRCGYDDAGNGGGFGNSLILSHGAKIYSTLNDSLTDGGGVGVAGHLSIPTTNNTLLVTGEGSLLTLGNQNFNIGYMQTSYATGGWNRVSVVDHGMITNLSTLSIGRVSGSSQQSWSNSLSVASEGSVWVNNAINVGDARSTGNRIIMAGGSIQAKTLTVKAGNGITAVLNNTTPVPATFTTRATFEAQTYVWPALAEGVHDGFGGIILTAPEIVDNGLELAPETDPVYWKLTKTSTTVSLFYHRPTTLITVR